MPSRGRLRAINLQHHQPELARKQEATMQPGTGNKDPTRAWSQNLWIARVRDWTVVLIVMLTVRSAVADWNNVPTGSMKPTILEGDRIFVNRLAYDVKVPFIERPLLIWSDPKRDDIVVFHSPTDGTLFVKRVIGLPGDRIRLSANRVFINGEPADYEPLDSATPQQLPPSERAGHHLVAETFDGRTHAVMTTPEQPGPADFGPVTVPPGQYFVMGDNRDNSMDSRFFGFVARERIVGRAMAVVMSLDPESYLSPRWQRFFHGLS
jgi:signal peptidase I